MARSGNGGGSPRKASPIVFALAFPARGACSILDALSYGYRVLVKLLDPALVDSDGCTAVDIAKKKGDTKALALLSRWQISPYLNRTTKDSMGRPGVPWKTAGKGIVRFDAQCKPTAEKAAASS